MRRFRNLVFTGPISGSRYQFVQKGELKVRIPNPHNGGSIDWSLLKAILRQAGVKVSDWDKAALSAQTERILRKLGRGTASALGLIPSRQVTRRE
jgi:hypothetical protein